MSGECNTCGLYLLQCKCLDDETIKNLKRAHLSLIRSRPDIAEIYEGCINEKEFRKKQIIDER